MRTTSDGGGRVRRRHGAMVAVLLACLLGVSADASAGASAHSPTAARLAAGPAGPVPASGVVPGERAPAERAPETAPGYPWVWPVAGARAVVEPFRAPAHDYGPGHRGMDVAAASGAVVVAPAAGTVAFRGTVVDRPVLTIDHGGGYVTTFEPLESDLSPGDPVRAGEPIGAVGAGGHTARGALHVGVRVDGDYANPRPFFGAVPRAVLLPCCTG